MVDTQLLEEKIASSGKKKQKLAEACGLSTQALRLKVKGVYDFSSMQIDALCRELEIKNLTEKEKIFFKK